MHTTRLWYFWLYQEMAVNYDKCSSKCMAQVLPLSELSLGHLRILGLSLKNPLPILFGYLMIFINLISPGLSFGPDLIVVNIWLKLNYG